MADHLAFATVEIEASPEAVWSRLVDPLSAREYMFGSQVLTDWSIGGPILFRGLWEGRPYEDKGVVMVVDEPLVLSYTHYSPLSGAPDIPASYHTLTFTLESVPPGTRVTLTQDNNDTAASAEHSAGMWRQLLETLRTIVER
ncbi:MAG: SRPBCC domain-containing protein [Cellulomonas sp.]